MGTYRYDGARERELGPGLDLLNVDVKAVVTDNTLYGLQISAATNATPINITTTASHGLTTGDNVAVFGVLVNTAANGRWKVTVIDATHFTLDTSVGNGVGTTEFVVDLSNKVYLSDIPSGARVAISGNLTGKSITRGIFNATDTTLTGVAGAATQSVNIFVDTGTPATSLLIAHSDSGVGQPTPVNPGTVNILWDDGPNKIFEV